MCGRVWVGALLSVGALASCVTNHSALERKPGGPEDTGGVGGVGGASAGAGPRAGTGGEPLSSGGRADDEPPGTDRLTIVNGVVDAPTVVVCLSKLDADGNAIALGDPIAALDYAESAPLGKLPKVDVAQDTVQPFLIAGDLELIRGLNCKAAIERARDAELVASPPPVSDAQGGAAGAESAAAGADSSAAGSAGQGGEGGEGGAVPEVRSVLRVRGLPAIPAGTLNQGRSLALIANGCMGGATYGTPSAEEYCGLGYTERAPTLSAVLVNLSRVVSPGRVGMQVVHASLINGEVGLDTIRTPPFTGSGVTLVSRVTYAQVAPRPASLVNTVADLGSSGKFSVEVSSQGQAQFSEPWAEILKSGGLTELAETRTYALVLSGPRLDLSAVPGLWNGPALTAIAVDPD
jgi:hypothetical protein